MSIYCKNCGKELKDTAAFCSSCGTKVEKKEVVNSFSEENTRYIKAEEAVTETAEERVTIEKTVAEEIQKQEPVNYQAYQAKEQQWKSQSQGYQYHQPAPNVPDWDHTAEFDAKDISLNKVVAMLAYLMGAVGIIIALLGSATSPYAGFHVRQALKFLVIETLTLIATAFLFWTIIVPIVAAIFIIVLFVVKIICFFSICGGKAKEPPIIRSFGFLR